MNLHLLVPSLFWPDATLTGIYRDLPLPALENLLAKSTCTDDDTKAPERSEGLEAWLCRAFNVPEQQDWPVAPITLTLDGDGKVKCRMNTGFVPTPCICISSTIKSCWLIAVSSEFPPRKRISLRIAESALCRKRAGNGHFYRSGPIAGIYAQRKFPRKNPSAWRSCQ